MGLENRVGLQQRLFHLGLCGCVFAMCYLLGNAMAQQQGITRNVATALDSHIYFLPWMIVPYMSSGLVIGAAFLAVNSADDLRVLSQRLLLATALAGLIFALYPLRFSVPRPEVGSHFLAKLFDSLALLDRPYNQLPSLHVTYCVIVWASLRGVLRPGWARRVVGGWLVLTAVATLFIYQHHILDVLAGMVLGVVCLRRIRPGQTEAGVAFHYAMAGLLTGVLGLHLWPHAVMFYAVLSLWGVSYAYWRRDRHFLHKQGGAHPGWVWLLYAPYLLGYRLTWWVVVCRGRRSASFRQVSPQLWIGRRLGAAEAGHLPAGCQVFDLGNELPETATLRGNRYRHFPLLDIVTPAPDAVAEIIAALDQQIRAGHSVYLHCAMGYRRSEQIAQAYLARQPQDQDS